MFVQIFFVTLLCLNELYLKLLCKFKIVSDYIAIVGTSYSLYQFVEKSVKFVTQKMRLNQSRVYGDNKTYIL